MNKTPLKTNMKLKSLIGTLLIALFCVADVTAQPDGSQQNVIGRAGTFAIVGARIVTVTGPVIENGTVVVSNGKIAAVGRGVSIPSNAVRINGRGLSVYPGMIDAGTSLGLSEIPQGAPGSVDVAEVGDFNPNAKAITAIHPHSTHVNVTRINGITTVLSSPTGGLISGQSAVVNLWGATQSDMALVPEFGLVINFPRVTTGGGFGQQPVDFNEAVRRRDQRLDDLKKLFAQAEAYRKVQEAYAADKSLPAPRVDLKMEALRPYVKGERPVVFTVERERDIKGLVKFVEETKLKAIILGGQEAWKVSDDLKRLNIAVIFNNIYRLPVQDDDAYDYLFEAPMKMQKAGITFAISSGDSGANVRDLPYHAGLASAFGLDKAEALKAVTIYPAKILGVDDKVGSIEVGKIANLVVTTGDILEARTIVRDLFINGRRIPLTSRHTELHDRFKDRR
jgi:imidazolonepropionase-like amidohydrolase